MDKLTIVTPCSRPGNLASICPSIDAGRKLFDITWLVVFDERCVTRFPVPGATVAGVSDSRSIVGNAQRNLALDLIAQGWVYFLDDDNLMHPSFFTGLRAAIATRPDVSAFAFPQDMGSWTRRAAPETMRMGQVDMAQVCAQRDLIADRRFTLGVYEADGYFIQDLYAADPAKWVFWSQPCCFYNALR